MTRGSSNTRALKSQLSHLPRNCRSESDNPDRDKIHSLDILKPWKARHPQILPLAEEWSMCKLYRDRVNQLPAPSLAAIRPKVVTDLKVTEHPGWTRVERAKLEMHLKQ